MEIRMSKKFIYLSLLLSFMMLAVLLVGYYYVSGLPQLADVFQSIKTRLILLLLIVFVSFTPYFKMSIKMFFNQLIITDAEVKIKSFLNSQIIPVKQIADVHLDSTIVQRIFRIGNVSFETSGSKIFLFKNIDVALEKDIMKSLNL